MTAASTSRRLVGVDSHLRVMLPPVGDDYRLTVRLGREARRGWQRVSELTGCSVTAILEAIGQDLDADPGRLIERGDDLIQAARIIEQERRRRR